MRYRFVPNRRFGHFSFWMESTLHCSEVHIEYLYNTVRSTVLYSSRLLLKNRQNSFSLGIFDQWPTRHAPARGGSRQGHRHGHERSAPSNYGPRGRQRGAAACWDARAGGPAGGMPTASRHRDTARLVAIIESTLDRLPAGSTARPPSGTCVLARRRRRKEVIGHETEARAAA